eukprot:scaffold284363_cov32-Tisochrysis_lutea.AAC.4
MCDLRARLVLKHRDVRRPSRGSTAILKKVGRKACLRSANRRGIRWHAIAHRAGHKRHDVAGCITIVRGAA